jgi:hypothetical protein
MIGGTYTDPVVSIEILQQALDGFKKRSRASEEVRVLDENYLARFKGDSPNGYWQSRRFTAETQAKWGLGYDPIEDRCTIAFRDSSGNLLGVIQRRMDNEFPRYLYPKGFDRLGSLFGSWEIATSESDSIALTEGSTDAIRVNQTGYPAVAQYGSTIGPRQVKLLRKLGVREITLFYDYDEAGRKAEQQALEVLDGFIVYRVVWDESKYCWHLKLCGCGQHDWKSIAFCKNKKMCKCGRKHEMDPGKLKDKEIKKMIAGRVLAGKRKSIWHTRKRAYSQSVRNHRTAG